MTFTKVLIAEDIDISNEGIASKLSALDIAQVEQSQSCDNALLKIKRALHDGEPFQLLISDLSFVSHTPEPKLTSGQELITEVKRIQPNIKTIAFSVWNKQQIIKELIEDIKADAYICKGLNGFKELTKAINALAKNETYICPIATASLQRKNVFELTEYEKQILQLTAKGFKQQDISDYFKSKNITPNSRRSIEDHLSKLRDNFNASTTPQLIYLAQSLELI